MNQHGRRCLRSHDPLRRDALLRRGPGRCETSGRRGRRRHGHDRLQPALDGPATQRDGVTLLHGIELRVETETQRLDLRATASTRPTNSGPNVRASSGTAGSAARASSSASKTAWASRCPSNRATALVGPTSPAESPRRRTTPTSPRSTNSSATTVPATSHARSRPSSAACSPLGRVRAGRPRPSVSIPRHGGRAAVASLDAVERWTRTAALSTTASSTMLSSDMTSSRRAAVTPTARRWVTLVWTRPRGTGRNGVNV